ncbi:MAG: Hsp20/alpha crystallin family protein [Pontiellaceae bacterium]|nr:Hsp20/alpha crystallin family protein [Pontiellaceae bacterium]
MKSKSILRKGHSGTLSHRKGNDPFHVLHREINELFDGYCRGFGGSTGRRGSGSTGFELSETDDEIRVRVELPGMSQKDISVELEENQLTIRGERHEEKETKKRNYHVSEMSYGNFYRSIPLPAKVERDNASAKFKRGILTLTLPKSEEARKEYKRIPIQSA